jgi:DNA polymerase I-like protein with 3'-5' exonuclease and polymerase domains
VDIYTLDFETYYDDKYTLKKLTNEQYLRHPMFQVLCVGISRNGAEPVWVPGERVPSMMERLRPVLSESAVLCQHAQFDAGILSFHYNIHPKLILCTMSMARGRGFLRTSLEALANELGLPPKGTELQAFKGRRLEDLSLMEATTLGRYCLNDVRITWMIWERLRQGFPPHEIRSIDQVIRMFTQPRIVIDEGPLREHLEYLYQKRSEALARVPGDDEEQKLKTLRSNNKLAELLVGYGVTPPMKEGKKGPTYAFAATDEGFKALLNHENEIVREIVSVRLGVKSSIDETRCRNLLDVGSRGPLPIYLYYAGAQTTQRLSGGDKLNLQNLPKKHPADKKRAHPLRKALRAPAGYKIGVADSSQIEARLVAWQAGQWNVVEAFAGGRDVYSEMASQLYGRPIDRKNNPEDEIPGFVGKVAVLSMGYGVGFVKAAQTFLHGALGGPPLRFTMRDVEIMGVNIAAFLGDKSKVQRMKDAQPATLTEQEWLVQCAVTDAIVTRFRMSNSAIVRYWDIAEYALSCIFHGKEFAFGTNECVRVIPHVGLALPTGVNIYYKDLQRVKAKKNGKEEVQWQYTGRKEGRIQTVNLYGGKVVENITQALAACVIRQQMLVIGQRYPVLFQVHDEIPFLVPEEEAPEGLKWVLQQMSTTPVWAPGLPLAAEGNFGDTYGDAK